MADDRRQPEPTERTPHGYEVPVPSRGEFFGNLNKAARPDVDPATRERIARTAEESREALDLLAKGDEDQPDL